VVNTLEPNSTTRQHGLEQTLKNHWEGCPMQARDVKTAEDARKLLEKLELDHVKVGVFDIDGILRGSYMNREWEEREFRKHITDWEMERYFEII